MRVLITGANGFVGKHLKYELESNGYEIIEMDINANDVKTKKIDILDYSTVFDLINTEKPDAIFHLAGQSSVSESWSIPTKTFRLNVEGTINIIESVITINPQIKVLIIGSSDQYGVVQNCQTCINEETVLNPLTPYAVSKCAQEQIALVYQKAHSLNLYFTRSFNHIGVGQKKGFVVPDLASGIADIEAGKLDKLLVGNLQSKRDFSDVRDIARAYRLIVEEGKPGEIYNVGGGVFHSIDSILNKLLEMSSSDIKVQQDSKKMRKIDKLLGRCDYTKLKTDTGWMPQYNIEDTLKEVLKFFRSENNG